MNHANSTVLLFRMYRSIIIVTIVIISRMYRVSIGSYQVGLSIRNS